jgi:hypothetical protein
MEFVCLFGRSKAVEELKKLLFGWFGNMLIQVTDITSVKQAKV